MNEHQESERTGRRALFTGAGTPASREKVLSESEISEIIRQISSGKTEDSNIPVLFAPVTAKISELITKEEASAEQCRNLNTRLLDADNVITELKDEARQLGSERESYLNDLITSHTEFDRALEIFQYHEVPMVLTGPDQTIHDVNDAFCTLFSISRSEITTSHPPLNNYLPDEKRFIGQDNEEYTMVTLSPPVVPFDHEAESLVIFIKSSQIQDSVPSPPDEVNKATEPEEKVSILPDITSAAFEAFPIPAIIINQYRTIVRCNERFSRLVGREKETLYLRDIGSCGIKFSDSDCPDIFLADMTAIQCSAVVTHPNGNEIRTYIEILPLSQHQDERFVLIIAVESGNDDISVHEETETQVSSDFPQNSFIQLLMNLNPSASALLDQHARVLSSNEGFSEITGLSPGDLNGTDVRDLGISIPDSVLAPDASEAQYLPGTISLHSAWGIQELSGMVVPTGLQSDRAVAILVLQPIEKPELPKSPVEPVIIEKPGSPDVDRIPIPYLRTDFSGKIVQVNKAFLLMTGAMGELIVGRMRNELITLQSDERMILSVDGRSHTIKEIISPYQQKEENREYWYIEVTKEAEEASTLQDKILTLEKELKEVKEHRDTTSSSYQEISSDKIDIVEFELNQERYAIDITMVREVVDMLPVTPLPRTPPYVIGIINLRGEVTHIIDLSILLGEKPKKDRSGQKIIIIPSDVTKGEHVGIIVDNVQSVTEILGRQVSILGENITTQIHTHIKGIIKISRDDLLDKHVDLSRETTLVIWLDIQKILDDIQGTL